MFTHRVKIQLIPGSTTELSRKIQKEIMPFLKLQKGFCSGVTSIDSNWDKATEDTYWQTREDAESYQQTAYQEVLKVLSGVVKTTPTNSIFEFYD